MDMHTEIQGAHDLQGALMGDNDENLAGVAARGAVGGAGVIPSTLGAQQLVEADVHVPAHHVLVAKKGMDKSDTDSGRDHSSSIDDLVCAHFSVDLTLHFSFRGSLHFRVLPIAVKQ